MRAIPMAIGVWLALFPACLALAQSHPPDLPPPTLPFPSTARPDQCDGNYDEPPRVLKHKTPTYPEEAKHKGIEGVVVLELKVDEEGQPSDIKVVKSVPGLDEAALEAAAAYVYKPAQKDGLPVATTCKQTFNFKLR